MDLASGVVSYDTSNANRLVPANNVQVQMRQSQSGLGMRSTLPEGGYGWIVFLATLFFQLSLPSLIVAFGIIIAYQSLEKIRDLEKAPRIWDEESFYTALFFCASWTIFDPLARYAISFNASHKNRGCLFSRSTWTTVFGAVGTCLVCAGLLIMWLGLVSYESTNIKLGFAGILTGIGTAIQIAQCELIVAQYFKLKHIVLVHITQAVTSLGFVLTPIALGFNLLKHSLLTILMWYAVFIMQGVIIDMAFKKPALLKTKQITYDYITGQVEDEEDIFSKNSRELQIKRQNSETIEKIQIEEIHVSNDPHTSGVDEQNDFGEKKVCQTLDHDDQEEVIYEKESHQTDVKVGESSWVKFDDTSSNAENYVDNDINSINIASNSIQEDISEPKPLYDSQNQVNLNNTYSFEDPVDIESHEPRVFVPNSNKRTAFRSNLDILKQLTFYKSWLMMTTTKFSVLVFYALFPVYFYMKIDTLKDLSLMVGLISVTSLVFSLFTYWIHVKGPQRAVNLWFFCWLGSIGYFMVSDAISRPIFITGGALVVLSISSLQHIGFPLLGLTVRGETNRQYNLLSLFSGLSFVFFLLINFRYIDIFRYMAMMHFVTGCVWFANFVYKRIR